MNKNEADTLFKIAKGDFPWVEFTPEAGVSWSLALEPYEYKLTLQAILLCLREEGRKNPPSVGEIMAQLKTLQRANSSPVRQYVISKPAEQIPFDLRRKQIEAAREKHPELYGIIKRAERQIEHGGDE